MSGHQAKLKAIFHFHEKMFSIKVSWTSLALFVASTLLLIQSAMAGNYIFTVFTSASESNMYVYNSTDALNFKLMKGPAYVSPPRPLCTFVFIDTCRYPLMGSSVTQVQSNTQTVTTTSPTQPAGKAAPSHSQSPQISSPGPSTRWSQSQIPSLRGPGRRSYTRILARGRSTSSYRLDRHYLPSNRICIRPLIRHC